MRMVSMAMTDFLVIGGGVLGISVARRLKREYGDATVTVLEKERACGLHASGRNSGVLHAGFYYPADSLKARYTRRGNKLLTEYCIERRLPINRCGKLVVARTPNDLAGLDELRRRGRANGVELDEVSEGEARLIEPRVKTHERALYCPTTATVDPGAVMQALTADATNEGVKVNCGVRYLGRQGLGLRTSAATYYAGYVVNAAGLYADRIAQDFGFAERYRILPFKGLYLSSDDPGESVHTNIYPVPDLRMPFLGVHVTSTATGQTKIGPTAIPTFWREQYSGFANFRFSEFVDLTLRQVEMLVLGGWGYQRLAMEELRKYSRRRLVALASSLMIGVREDRYGTWCMAGIRAQLVNVRRRTLEMDFVLEGDDRSMHVLNAVSPGFTCAIPFAEEVCKAIAEATVSRREAVGTSAAEGVV
jgi:L-2-hydroxyglutarate oxidase LhgO